MAPPDIARIFDAPPADTPGAAPPLRHAMVYRMFLAGMPIDYLAHFFAVSAGRIEAAIRQQALARHG